MATIKKGINGGFSGKAGSVIGSNWRDIDYIRGLSKKSTKAASMKQLEQRAKFATAVEFLQAAKAVFELGYKTQKTGKSTGYNIGLRNVLSDAIVGVYPDFSIDYSKVVFSKGSYGRAIGLSLVSAETGTVRISWDAEGVADMDPEDEFMNAMPHDIAIILLYNTDKQEYKLNKTAVRVDGEAIISLPASYSGDEVVGWVFFTSENRALVSKSSFAGSAVIL